MTDLGPGFTVLAAFASTALTSAGLGIWISRQFDKQRAAFFDALERQRISVENKIDAHEEIDNERHTDNIRELASLRVTMAERGYNVGNGSKRPHS